MPSPAATWWRRASSTMKDHRSLYLCRISNSGHRAEIELAVIHSTSHDELTIDYKNSARVFAWARTSSSSFSLVMRALTRRATRTSSWPVALKTLLVSHGLLICCSNRLGRLPFDLSTFRDSSPGFSAFVRSYFQFLDHRSVFLSCSNQLSKIDVLVKMQDLVDLLLQIQPYGDGMGVGLVLEVMDCVIVEMFEMYGKICSCIAGGEWRNQGLVGMEIVRRAAEQKEKVSSYLGLCRGLGVINAVEMASIEAVGEEEGVGNQCCKDGLEIVVSEDWEVFEEEKLRMTTPGDGDENLFFGLEDGGKSELTEQFWLTAVHRNSAAAAQFAGGGNLIELI